MSQLNLIKPTRLLLYLMVLGVFPVIGAALHFSYSKSAIYSVQERVESFRNKATLQEKRHEQNLAILNHFREADHFYIDKNLETITLLEPEIESLQKVTENKNYTGDETIQKRLDHLTGPGNNIAFTEGVVQSHKLFQETTESLIHPVEAGVEDIKKLLALIEGKTIGPYSPAENRPQLIILDFKLDKKNQTETNQVYSLNLKLLKREYL